LRTPQAQPETIVRAWTALEVNITGAVRLWTGSLLVRSCTLRSCDSPPGPRAGGVDRGGGPDSGPAPE